MGSARTIVTADAVRGGDLDARLARVPPPPAMEIIAHRGGAAFAPENTLVAFGASAGRAHGAEFDVDYTADGVPVVIHDSTVDRTTDGSGDVQTFTLAQLQALDAGSWFDARFAGARIPTLEEVLLFCGRRFRLVYPEIKRQSTPAQVAAITDLVRAVGLEDRCIMQSFWFETNFPLVRAQSSRITLGYLVQDINRWNAALPLAEADGNAMLLADYNIVLGSPALVDDARSRGVDVGVWTVDTADIVLQLLDIGVTRIMSNTLVSPQVAL